VGVPPRVLISSVKTPYLGLDKSLQALSCDGCVYLLFIPVAVWLLIVSLTPARRSAADGMAIFDAAFFVTRIPLAAFAGLSLIYLAINVFQGIEFRSRGMIEGDTFQTWAEFESHNWNVSNDSNSCAELTFKTNRRPRLFFPNKIDVPVEYRQQIEDLIVNRS